MDARRGRDAERGRLQRAAYRRDATDADREALAAFERREAVREERRAAPPPVASIADGVGRSEPVGEQPSRAPEPRRRRPGLVLAAVALASAAAGATVAAVAVSAAMTPPALTALTDAPAGPQRASAGDALSLFLEGLEIEGTLPIAGPALLTTTDRFDVYGFLHADGAAEGRQKVCLGVVGIGGYTGSSGTSCADVADFRRDGLRIGLDAPGTGDIGEEAVWHPDGSVEVSDGP